MSGGGWCNCKARAWNKLCGCFQQWQLLRQGENEERLRIEMNAQAHMSGQISGQVPNQGGLPQQNVNPLQPSEMQNLGVAGGLGAGGIVGAGGPAHNTLNMDPDLIRIREFMRGKM